MRPSRLLLASAAFSLGLSCTLPALARMDGGPAAADDPNMVMYLGNVEVRGQQNITRTLQAIKVALTLPYSNDPKLANMMVCRFEQQAGSHVKEELICGTNRLLSQQRAALQSAMIASAAQNSGGTNCVSDRCYQTVFDALNTVIRQTSGHFLHTTVDGSALRTLLQQVPMPEPGGLAPPMAPTATPAPTAASTPRDPHTI